LVIYLNKFLISGSLKHVFGSKAQDVADYADYIS